MSAIAHLCLPKRCTGIVALTASNVAAACNADPSTVTIAAEGRTASFPVANAAALPANRAVTIEGEELHLFLEPTAAVGGTPRAERAAAERKAIGVRKVFVVGAGGIGCELLKNIVLAGATDVTLIDMDTIDATNLNRQFLFAKRHVGQPKAVVAAEVVGGWRAEGSVGIAAIEGNVKDARFGVEWYRGFDVVINGLDNVGARKHVNRMCIQAGTPLIESGTMGYNGQVQPIVKGRVECYDCRPKPTDQKTFAVCTIHARPTTIVHCVHYAKEVFARLFGDQIAATAGTVSSSGGGAAEPKSELDYVDRSSFGAEGDDAALCHGLEIIHDALFVDKIKELLALKTDWSITPPAPLAPAAALSLEGEVVTSAKPMGASDADVTQRKLVLQMVAAVRALIPKARRAFSKDDDDAVHFVAAVANLRALNFHIAPETNHKLKTVAGNIIPAIASTNAVIAAVACHRGFALATDGQAPSSSLPSTALRHVAQMRRRTAHVSTANGTLAASRVRDRMLLHSFACERPNEACLVCSENQRQVSVSCNAAAHTLGSFVRIFLTKDMSLPTPTVDLGCNTLYEHDDFEDLRDQPLAAWLPPNRGACITLTVGDLNQAVEWTVTLAHNFALDDATFEVAGDLAALKAAAAAGEATAKPATMAPADDDGAVVAYNPAKRNRGEMGAAQADIVLVDDD